MFLQKNRWKAGDGRGNPDAKDTWSGNTLNYSLVFSLSSFVRLHFCFPTINLSGIGNGTTSCRPRVRSGICMTCLVHLLLRGSRFLAQ